MAEVVCHRVGWAGLGESPKPVPVLLAAGSESVSIREAKSSPAILCCLFAIRSRPLQPGRAAQAQLGSLANIKSDSCSAATAAGRRATQADKMTRIDAETKSVTN